MNIEPFIHYINLLKQCHEMYIRNSSYSINDFINICALCVKLSILKGNKEDVILIYSEYTVIIRVCM